MPIFYCYLTVDVDLWSASISCSCFLTGFGHRCAIHHISRISLWFCFCSGAKPLFVSSVWPVHISGNQNQSPAPGVRRPTSPGRSHLPGVNSGGLVVLIDIPWHIFLFEFKISLKCGPKSTLNPLQLSSFPFFHFPLVSSAFYSFPENIAQLFPNLKPITES